MLRIDPRLVTQQEQAPILAARRHFRRQIGRSLPARVQLASGLLIALCGASAAATVAPGPRPSAALAPGVPALIASLAGALALILAVGLVLRHLERARAAAQERERLRQSEVHHRSAIELDAQIRWLADPDGDVIEIGPRWAELTGLPVATAVGRGWIAAVHAADLPGVLASWRKTIAAAGHEDADTRYRLKLRNGDYRWFRVRARARFDGQGRVARWYGSLEDVDDQVGAELALRASEERYRLASRATKDVIWDWSLTEDRIVCSDAAETVLGYPEARAGTSQQWWIDRIHPDDRPRVLALQRRMLRAGKDHWSQEFRFRVADGRYLDLLSRGYLLRDERGRPRRLLGALQDVSARNRRDEELRRAAHHDPLTGLPNRTLFSIRLAEALEQASASGGLVALIVINVDRFKALNDMFGHLAGDALLSGCAARLAESKPAGATVARLGGDEFAVILAAADPNGPSRAKVAAMLGGMADSLSVEGRPVELSISAGSALFPRDASNAEDLLKAADLALRQAKAEAPGRIRQFEPRMRDRIEQEKRVLQDAREALGDDRIIPFYQPKICLASGRIIGFEALLRWHHDRRGLQPPAALAAAFHDGQLAVELTDRMLDCIGTDMWAWLEQGCAFGRIAVNGSAEDFRRGDFADRILAALAKAGIPPTRLELEVTETVFLSKHMEQVKSTLRTLRAEGVTIALDDFGTGYASLTHLQQFPVDAIKIDQSFVASLTQAGDGPGAIVNALIDLGKNLKIATIAEGVETLGQAELLRSRGCDAAQGYLFGRAIAAAFVPGFIRDWDPNRLVRHHPSQPPSAAASRPGFQIRPLG